MTLEGIVIDVKPELWHMEMGISTRPAGRVIANKDGQSENAFSPIDVTEDGITIDVRPDPWHIELGIDVIPVPNVNDAKLLQPSNALAQMDVTEEGITTDCKLVHPAKPTSIVVHAGGSITAVREVLPGNPIPVVILGG